MLKVQPSLSLSNSVKAKCGEIFCHSLTEFTIYCTFCDMKSFIFEDFHLHIKNVHFKNNLLETDTIKRDCNQFLQANLKNEDTEDDLWNNVNNAYEDVGGTTGSDDDNCGNDSYKEEETVTVLRKFTKRANAKRKEKSKRKKDIDSIEEDNDHNSDEDIRTVPYGAKTSAATDVTNCIGLATISTTPENKEKLSKPKKKDIIEHSCPECQQIFAHLKYLDRHVFEFHNGYKCSQCDKRFRLRHHLRGHAKTHTTEKSFTCPVKECGRSFTDQDYLKRHLEVHTMDCTFVCDFENCGKAFQTQRRLLIHTYTHRKPKKLVCDACGYSCRASITLRIHQRVHTGEKPFPCEVCDKRFVSKTALTEHMISHSNTRPHICKTCNASFANPRVLQRHMFIHSDERTFKCKLCDSAFKQAGGLDGHMRRLHRAPKPTTAMMSLKTS